MGVVQGCALFHARHKDSTQIRATLKILPTDVDPRAAADLKTEGELLFKLRHPNIVTVRNLRLSLQPPFLEMDELVGEPLAALIDKQHIYMAQALDLVEQLLGALVYLHARSIVHRDIHPGTLVVRADGGLTLMGFGYASRLADEDDLPITALGYLLPEWPRVEEPVHTDLYAVGCLLYHLLTGRSPFDAPVEGGGLAAAVVLERKREQPFLDPGARFQEDLRAIVRMLTSVDPRARFISAARALGRLQRVERSYAG